MFRIAMFWLERFGEENNLVTYSAEDTTNCDTFVCTPIYS